MPQWTIRTVERCNWFDPLELVRMLHNVVGARTLRERGNQLALMIDAQFELSFAHQYHRTSYRWVCW
jgi:hypothetical protein